MTAEDPRTLAFRSAAMPELFHAVAYSSDVWKPDPFDVETIHGGVRRWFDRSLERASAPERPSSGRMLLLLGESGGGKTHLMRAFRNRAHGLERGYVAYMQMTAFTGEYGRYVLNNLVESLDRPYFEERSTESGLARLARRLAESADESRRDDLDRLRSGELNQAEIDQAVDVLAGALIRDERFHEVDADLIQALLYLQADDPRIKAVVLKYLRCEDLSDRDQAHLGGLVPRLYADAPHWMIERLGKLMWALEHVPLIICVDQLEDVFDLDEAAVKFRKAMAVLCDIVSRLPSALVIISCLENFYDELKKFLTRSTRDRVESDPRPVSLQTPRELDEVRALIGRRLQRLFESRGVAYRPEEPTFPIPDEFVERLAGLRARDVLGECQAYRERCVEEGKMAAIPTEGEGTGGLGSGGGQQSVNDLEQAWNAFRTSRSAVVPSGEPELARALAEAIGESGAEAPGVEPIRADADGRFVDVEAAGDRLLVGVCNKAPQGGHLAKQIDELSDRADGRRVIAARSTGFPGKPGLAITKTLAAFEMAGGRRVVIEDSDWRTMTAFAAFLSEHRADPAFESWRKRTRPLTSLGALRTILELDQAGEAASTSAPGTPIS